MDIFQGADEAPGLIEPVLVLGDSRHHHMADPDGFPTSLRYLAKARMGRFEWTQSFSCSWGSMCLMSRRIRSVQGEQGVQFLHEGRIFGPEDCPAGVDAGVDALPLCQGEQLREKFHLQQGARPPETVMPPFGKILWRIRTGG